MSGLLARCCDALACNGIFNATAKEYLLCSTDYARFSFPEVHSLHAKRVETALQNRFDLSRWNIGRNIIGGDGAFGAGSIQSNGNLGSLTVGGDIKGGKGDHTGKVSVFGNSGKIHVLGSVLGGAGGSAGNVSVEKSLASLTIDGELVGGTTAASYKSGYIHVGGALGPVAVNGNMKGGLGEFSGVIDVDGAANDTVFLGLTGDFMLHEI